MESKRRRGHRTARKLALGAAACCTALLVPGNASAGPGGLKYVSDHGTSPAGAQGYAGVMCPPDRHPLGGGVQSGGGFGQVHVVRTGPLAAGGDPDALADGWGVKVDNITGLGGPAFAVRSHAICAKGYVVYKSSGGLDIEPGDTRSVSLGGGCGGPSLYITGGGVGTSAGFNEAHVVRTYPYPAPTGAWGATVHNIGTHEEHMYVTAICAPGDYTYVSTAKTIGPLEQARVQARCPQNTHVVGGGGTATGELTQLHLNASYPRDLGDTDKAPDDAWRVKTDDLDLGTRTLTVYAVCRG